MDNIFKIPKLLGSSNWDIWSIRIEALLIQQGYKQVMTNDIGDLSPQEHLILEDKSERAISYIRLALSDGPLLQTRFITNPYLLWIKLQELYETSGFSSEFLLSRELINTTLDSSNKDLEKYVQTFTRIVNSLTAKDIILPKKFLVALLLNNLNKDYENVVAIITQTIRIAKNEEIDLDSVISQLLDESRRLKSIRNKKSNSVTTISSNKNYNSNKNYSNDIEMSLSTNKVNKRTNNKKIICNFCKKEGHKDSYCYKKFPEKKPNYNNKKSKLSRAK